MVDWSEKCEPGELSIYQKEKKSWTSFLLVAELMFATWTVAADMMFCVRVCLILVEIRNLDDVRCVKKLWENRCFCKRRCVVRQVACFVLKRGSKDEARGSVAA